MSRNSNIVDLDLGVFFVFLACKLCGVIDWSWWWVFSPLWIPLAGAVIMWFLLQLFF